MRDDLNLPQPSDKRIAIHVKPAAERALRNGHPWLFDQAIRKQSHDGPPGDLAVIFDSKRRFLAVGLYDPDSPIRVRVLQHRDPATINRDWFTRRLQQAATIRAPLAAQNTDGYRLVHGENDGLPGLIIDRYAATLVIKLYTAAWLPHLNDVIAALETVQPFGGLVLRTSRNIDGISDGLILRGEDTVGQPTFTENGLRFHADVIHGHKTGFFFDQRNNRAMVRQLAHGRHVLDVFAYTGGFSVYAAAGGAKAVTSMDISEPALAAARQNMVLNPSPAEHITIAADAFEGMAQLNQTYDMVIVDPPAFAKTAAEVDRALSAYTRLTQLALERLESGGMLVMASCSSRITPDQFFTCIHQASNHGLHEIKRTGHAIDHPVGFPEGEYLKCLFTYG
jgi:23S rRNA (cytosine1962-C5)-methyltransferase